MVTDPAVVEKRDRMHIIDRAAGVSLDMTRYSGTVSWTCTIIGIMLASLSVSPLLFDIVHILACYKEHDCSMLSVQS